MRIGHLILSFIIIFIVESLFRYLGISFVLIFPTFVIVLVFVDDVTRLLPLIVIASVLFDPFSGLSFGVSIFLLLLVIGTIQLVRSRIALPSESMIGVILVSVVFMLEYVLLSGFFVGFSIVLQQLTVIIIGTAAASFLIFLIHGRIRQSQLDLRLLARSHSDAVRGSAEYRSEPY